MECPSCGTRNPEGAVSCSQCSSSLIETSLPTLPLNSEETPPSQIETEFTPIDDATSETLFDAEQDTAVAETSLPFFGARQDGHSS